MQSNEFSAVLQSGFLQLLIICRPSKRLNRLDIPTLDLRRLRADLIWYYKIFSVAIIAYHYISFISKGSTHITRDHPHKIISMRNIRVALFVLLFNERVVNIWNILPGDTDFSLLACFIQHINSLDFSKFCYINSCCSVK